MAATAPRSLVQDVSQPSGDGVVQNAKGRTALGFVQTYNTLNPNAPFRFKSGADYLAFKKANIQNLAGPIYSKMIMTIYPTATDNLVVLPFTFNEDQFVYVDWGDGSPINRYAGPPSHMYATQTIYTITITGTANSYGIGNVPTPGPDPTLGWYNTISIDAWLPTLTSLSGALAWQGANLSSVPATLPPSVSDLSYMFFQSTLSPNDAFTATVYWDVSNVVNMNAMFYGANLFNQPLSAWNLSRVTNMDNMFENTLMQQDLSSWALPRIVSAQNIFAKPTSVRWQMISEWYPDFQLYNPALAAVPDEYYTGTLATAPPGPPPAIGGTLRFIFVLPAADTITLALTGGSLPTIYWGDGIDPDNLLEHTYAAAGTYVVTATGGTPTGFTGITKSDGSPVALLAVASWFNSLTDLTTLFTGQPYNFTVPKYLPSSATVLFQMFSGATAFNQPINSWNTTNVSSMKLMFSTATAFNQPIHSWNTANVTTMNGMFQAARSFNQPLNSWNTGAVTNMSDMFIDATSFNQSLSSWNTAAVTTMAGMFQGATSFNGDISSWNTAAATTMAGMFQGATAFNRSLSTWITTAVTSMAGMFRGARSFNQPLLKDGSQWNIATVTDMTSMFNGATAFNQNLSSWTPLAGTLDAANIFANGAPIAQKPVATYWPPFTASGGGADPSTNPAYYTAAMVLAITVSADDIAAGPITLKMGFLGTAPGQPGQSVTIDWGDGSTPDTWTAQPSHTYAAAGASTLTITGTVNAFNGITNGNGLPVIIESVTSWLDSLTDLSSLFAGQPNNIPGLPATLPPNIRNLANMFYGATAFNGAIGVWTTTTVSNMAGMFYGATAFTQNIVSWNISSLTTAKSIFGGSAALAAAGYGGYWPNFATNTNLPDPTTNPEYYIT